MNSTPACRGWLSNWSTSSEESVPRPFSRVTTSSGKYASLQARVSACSPKLISQGELASWLMSVYFTSLSPKRYWPTSSEPLTSFRRVNKQLTWNSIVQIVQAAVLWSEFGKPTASGWATAGASSSRPRGSIILARQMLILLGMPKSIERLSTALLTYQPTRRLLLAIASRILTFITGNRNWNLTDSTARALRVRRIQNQAEQVKLAAVGWLDSFRRSMRFGRILGQLYVFSGPSLPISCCFWNCRICLQRHFHSGHV